MNDILRHHLDGLSERVDEVMAEVKPRLRGWLHLAVAPLALVSGIVLVVLSPDATTRLGSAVFAASAVVLFTVSAIYHRGRWSPRTREVLKRFDHSNIFVLIAGSCTPFGLLLLDGADRWTMLSIVWGGAVAGVAMKVLWAGAPRWLSAPIYIALGWAPVFFFGDFVDGAMAYGDTVGITVLVLIVTGGALYTLGGLVYGTQRPNPWPSWFGFHEVFHTFTIVAFAAHYAGVSVATYSLR
ncbi:MAG: FIG01964566: Predicted membrane protein, hemolysin III homolog [uncultured Nocardioides sp.]|uniref:FIG01964566: Predicted membrane protein, hemolysin III homolog n=1 Tax=uncultured Nocardioides sp. TaxID=198441 RepID=A0A6J4N5X4_9ACTN|nr:MAG: FIG01964566: Predicted membrane protein, hemolysin III homolog [uncultured Nocardioides sp.]